MRKHIVNNCLLWVMLLLVLNTGLIHAQNKSDSIKLPGRYKNFTLLPNGWKLSPQGKQIPIGELPLNMVITKNQHYAITSNSGRGINSLSVVNLKIGKEIQRLKLDNTWVGLTFGKNDKTLYVSGGNDNNINILNFIKGKLTHAGLIKIGKKFPKNEISITGLAFVKKRNLLLAVSQKSNKLYVIDAKRKSILQEVKMDGKCYTVLVNHAQTYAYVSIWGQAFVEEVNLNNFTISHVYKTGNHPNEMAISPNDSRLFVANANNNSVTVLNLKDKTVSETLITSLIPNAPYGSTPDALALSPDGHNLYVANADNNYIAVFDVSKKAHAHSNGFIPVGWYPTSVKILSKTKKIVVANGKGISSRANPNGPNPTKIKRKDWKQNYTGTMFKGTMSIINLPSAIKLEQLSKQIYENTPYVNNKNLTGNHQHIIPLTPNGKGSNKIKHVFYIIRENRSYDQVLGDIGAGNSDSSLCLFGSKITPNAHKLALDYTLYDNFYVDAEVSADGHNWSTAAYASDYVEKIWPVNYGNRGASYDFEGGVPIAAPTSGYIWNDVLTHNKSIRNYGEFVTNKKGKTGNYYSRDKNLRPYTYNKYPGFDLNISDSLRYKVWAKDFERLDSLNKVSDFTLIRLPNDHCWGTKPGKLIPQSYVAQNDDALGKIVQKISHSKIWKQSIIFVLEDDAQNGPDHVDAHRSILLVIGPNVKRHFIDHTMYSTSGVLRTIELILGLPPMTQYDLSAHPIIKSITDTSNLTPYIALAPRINLHNKNSSHSYGARLSKKLNFSRADAIPDDLYNKILWKAVRGSNAKVPLPVHSAFVNEHLTTDDD